MFNPRSYYADVLHSDLKQDLLFPAGRTEIADAEHGDIRFRTELLRQTLGRCVRIDLIDINLHGSNWLDDVEREERLYGRVRSELHRQVQLSSADVAPSQRRSVRYERQNVSWLDEGQP